MKCAALIVSGLMMAAGSFARGDDADAKALQGTWKMASAELSGKAFPEQIRKITTLVIDSNKYEVKIGEESDEGTTEVDSTKSPKTMKITSTKGPNKGKTLLAIYELKDDTLRICYDLSGKAFPAEFKTEAQKPLFLVTYKRDKQ